MNNLEKELYVATTLAMLWVLTQTHQASAEELGPPKSVLPTDLRVPPKDAELPPELRSGADAKQLSLPPPVTSAVPKDEPLVQSTKTPVLDHEIVVPLEPQPVPAANPIDRIKLEVESEAAVKAEPKVSESIVPSNLAPQPTSEVVLSSPSPSTNANSSAPVDTNRATNKTSPATPEPLQQLPPQPQSQNNADVADETTRSAPVVPPIASLSVPPLNLQDKAPIPSPSAAPTPSTTLKTTTTPAPAPLSSTSLGTSGLETNKSPNRRVQTDKLGYIFGIDVSDYQENVDWKKVADSGVSFAYLKATEGGSFRTEIFEPYRKAARENGIITGAYHFFQPAVPAHLQAENFLAKIGKLEADDLPPALDLEDPAIWTGFSRKEKISMVLTWLKTVEAKTGVRPIIYTGPTFMEDVLHSAPELASYDLWLAHYTSDKSPSLPHSFSKWQLWQYSDQGNIAGVEGGVDMNRFAGDKSQLLALGRTRGNVLPSQVDLVASALVTPGAKPDEALSASKATPKQPNQDDGIISFDVANL